MGSPPRPLSRLLPARAVHCSSAPLPSPGPPEEAAGSRSLSGTCTESESLKNTAMSWGKSCKINLLSRGFLQFTKKKAVAGENSFTDTMRHALSSRLSVPDCPNCNYRRR